MSKTGRNLYYEQLERECDPKLLHLHLSRDEALVIQIVLCEYVYYHDNVPDPAGTIIDILYRRIAEFLRGE